VTARYGTVLVLALALGAGIAAEGVSEAREENFPPATPLARVVQAAASGLTFDPDGRFGTWGVPGTITDRSHQDSGWDVLLARGGKWRQAQMQRGGVQT